MFSQKQGNGKRLKASKKSTKRARRQPRQSRMGIASPAKQIMRPMTMTTTRNRPRGRPTNRQSSCRITGTDFLTAITTSGTAPTAGDVLYTAVVNPKTLGIGRLATMSTLFERYKFKSLKFRYVPVAPTTTPGQLIGYVDYDTYDDPTGLSGPQNLQRAAGHYGEKATAVWEGGEKPVFWEIKDVDPMTDLYVDSDGTDPRWTNQGRFVLLAASALTATLACGNIYLDYDIEFYIPQIESTPSSGFGMKVTGGGSMSAAAPLGSAPVISTWSNLPVTLSGQVFTFQPGCYLFTSYLTGTVISNGEPTLSATGTQVQLAQTTASDAKNNICVKQFYCSVPCTMTEVATATTITASTVWITMLPSNGVTAQLRKLDRIDRMLRAFDGLKEIKESLRQSEAPRGAASSEEKYATSIVTGPKGACRVIDDCAFSSPLNRLRATSPRRSSDEFQLVHQ